MEQSEEENDVSKYLKVATEHLKQSNNSNKENLEDDVKGFLITLGYDLNKINDIRSRRQLMLEIQNLVFSKLYAEPATSYSYTYANL